MSGRLARLLAPRSVAVLGGGWAETVVDRLQAMGFAGPVWPVHPTRGQMAGLRCLTGLDALPHPPDAVFLGINSAATVEAVAALSAMGAGGAVCFASGWAETGDAALQARLVAAAGAMPVLGPNCYGLVNYLDGVALWPDQHGGRRVGRGVAIVSQSGNIALNLTMQARGLPLGIVACLGNAAQVGLADLAEALLADARVTALGLHVEGIGDAPAFAAMAGAARAAGKGIVAVKTGRSEGARAAAASHSASMAGDGAVTSAFLAQCGVAEVSSPAELLETLKILHVHGPLSGRRVAAVACSGGEAGLVADLAARLPLELPAPDPARRARLGAVLGPRVALANPLDYQTFIWGDRARTAQVFAAALEGMDAGLYLIDLPRADRCDPSGFLPALEAIADAQAATGRPALPVASLPENLAEAQADALVARGLAPLMGVETALAAVAAAGTPAGDPDWRPWPAAPIRATRLLAEDAAKALLAGAGIAVPRGVSAPDLATLGARAGALVPPLALKGLGFAHKTEAGAVRLGLAGLEGQAPMPGAQGYLAEEMVAGVAELLVAVRRDPVHGGVLSLGLGGTAAELLGDVATLVLPVTDGQIAAALRGLRLWPLLDGHRGRPRADLPAAIAVARALAGLLERSAALEEIEVNPLILRACGGGAVAVDALIREAT